MQIPNNRHAKFAQYCLYNGITELEYKLHKYELFEYAEKIERCYFSEGTDYRVPGDKHWPLRLKWINSDNTLPIEYKRSDGAWDNATNQNWSQETEYREGVIKEVVPMQESALNMQIGGSHYKECEIQPIQYIEANKLAFLEGCVVKRATRHNKPTGKGRQDIEKAIHELQLILELRYPKDEVRT